MKADEITVSSFRSVTRERRSRCAAVAASTGNKRQHILGSEGCKGCGGRVDARMPELSRKTENGKGQGARFSATVSFVSAGCQFAGAFRARAPRQARGPELVE